MIFGANRGHSHSERVVSVLAAVGIGEICTLISLADVQNEDRRDLELRPSGVAPESSST